MEFKIYLLENLLLFQDNTTNHNSTVFSNADILIGTFSSVGAGIALLFAVLPIPLITHLLKRSTLWEWENIWLFQSTTAFVICPVVLFFSILPIDSIRFYIHKSGLFLVKDWVPGTVMIALWCAICATSYSIAVDWLGLLLTNSMVFPLGISVTMLSKVLCLYSPHDLKEFVFVSGQSIMFYTVLILSVISFVMCFIAAIIIEKSTREFRKEQEEQVAIHIASVSKSKAHKKKKKRISPSIRVILRYYIGLITAVISACSFFLLPLGFYRSHNLFEKMNSAGFSRFQSHTALLSIGLFFGYLPSVSISLILLLVNRTIKKYAILSGGIVAICVNFKFMRLVSIFLSIFMGIMLTGSLFIQWSISDIYFGGFSGEDSFNYGIWNVTICCLIYVSLSIPFSMFPLMECRETHRFDRILLAVGIMISLLSIYGSTYFSYPSKWELL